MPDEEKKPETGPVVVRKGHVKPPPPGSRIEEPVVEPLVAGKASAEPAADPRPQWQRLAEEKASGAPKASERPPPRKTGGPGRPGARPPGAGRREPPRGERDRRPHRRDAAPGERPQKAAAAPPLPPGEPPPAPADVVAEEGSFADLLANAEDRPRRRFEAGEKVAGKILQIGQDVAFLELGSGLADGMIEVVELKDDSGNLEFRPGDIVDGVVVKGGERGVVVSRGRARLHADRRALFEAARAGLPVEGVVKGHNKGGLEVEVMGQRAFCPVSQIDVRFVGDPATFVGQKLRFRISKADERDVVLSRRALLEEERAEQARRTRESLAPGATFEGTVTSVQDYGAFVDIGGVEGLVHVSELAWDRVSRPADLLKAGDKVQVQVLRVDEDPKKGERIALSVKALVPRPEPAEAPPRPVAAPPPPPKVGDVVKGAVDRVEPYGVFVRFPGGRGLVPAAETGTARGQDLRKAFPAGQEITCLVTEIDDRGRIRLSRTQAEAAEERREASEWMSKAPRGGGKGFGTLGDLLREKLKK
ncbi:MAG TPA: S1 RNA-binding domain-containing protein [Anaeromyxobacteraceae bacterium]|nr:S1 RNA-binding domain-containing protein [Anaeromyxobacteraceae bacterium]